ncbi:polar amino acid transport system substrate-binding protein [Pseudomonas duriflava]|uniref:Polar amino acid transport system substrate-binding protein n=1 Tax=Pseudomonas duriflava TaxID=459528 RepID=A0A562QIV7_9PSED|nr:transporter substrate-binding domain-containing protein [Pseudomonas duriflava]TWI56613.1 polar amino acid transport system substrate-binding protein [Pseudomonas duriflava]
MFRSIVRVLLLGVCLGANMAKAELPENYSMVVLTENFPPFNMSIDQKNFARDENIDGISTDVVREMFKRAGISYTLSLRFPWDRLYSLTQEQSNYALFSTIRTPEREDEFKWVGPLSKISWVLLAMPDSILTVNNLKEIDKYKVGAYKNDAVSQHLESLGLAPINALRDQENIKKLEKGQIDIWATTDPVGHYLAKQENVPNLKTLFHFKEAEVYLAINKNTPDEVVERLQKALDQMHSEGLVDEIRNNYL